MAKPHIVVDGRELAGRPTGVGRYLLNVLEQWAQTPDEAAVTVLVPGDVPPDVARLAPALRIESRPARALGTWYEQTALPREARRLNADVFFAPAYTAPLRLHCPFVVAVHDLSYFAHPEWFSAREGLRRRWITAWAARRAAAVVTISHFSAAELRTYLRLDAAKIVLAPPGAPPDQTATCPPVSARPRLVLYAGSIFARRGVPELIAAFAEVARTVPDARLALVGDNRATPPVDPEALAQAAGIADRVTWHRYASDEALHALYDQARAFAFLSSYEGFAMTPMEAIARGVPAVLRDTPIAREVYGDGAALVTDRTALVTALTTLLTDDAAHRAALARGRARLSDFSWAESAARIRAALLTAGARR